jgi:serine/threonine-protein kinase RsbW
MFFVAGEESSMRIQVVMTLPREAASVPLARRTVAVALSSAGVAHDCVSEVEVALSEACTNAYHHAGEGADYEVVINIGDEQLTVDVLDSGTGFGPRPAGSAASMPDDSAERGRGLALMAALTDRAVFDTVSGNGGSVHLMKRLRWAAHAPLLTSAPATQGLRGIP